MRESQKKYLDLIINEPYKIGHWVGFSDLTMLHNEWLKDFLFSHESQTLLAHRGSYKTTDLSLFLAINAIIRPNLNTLFFRKTDTDVQEVIKQARNILVSPIGQKLVKELYGTDLILVKDTASEIHTNLCTSPRGATQIQGLGIGTSITGKHADIVVTDDIVNIRDRISRAERERTKMQYMELQNVCNRNGRFINTGTPWHKDDAISIMPNVKKYDCYQTGLISREKLKSLRQSMTDSLFAANYELKHIADKDAMFREPKFTPNVELLYGGVAHIDASYGGSDKTAFTVLRQRQGAFYAFGKCWDKHVDDCLSEIKVLHALYRAGTIHCEDNADKGYLRKELSRRGLPSSGYHESTNKFVKISTYLKKSWDNIFWIDDTDPEYINQILDYSEFAEHDDCPDSAASLLRIIERKIEANLFRGGI